MKNLLKFKHHGSGYGCGFGDGSGDGSGEWKERKIRRRKK